MKHEHDLIVIYSKGCDMESEVVRWCTVCGGVVIDIDYDGRTNPGQVMPMRFPEIAKQYMKMVTV
jgi:hypothetical protein